LVRRPCSCSLLRTFGRSRCAAVPTCAVTTANMFRITEASNVFWIFEPTTLIRVKLF
jgi:hypothetical protein